MINLFLANFLVNTCIFISGNYFKVVFEKKLKKYNYYNFWIFGIIFISFSSLLINFFFPLDKNICSILVSIMVIFFLKKYLFNPNLKIILKYLFIISIISTFLIIYSNVNRPDAGLYHLPYISMINEDKILIGSSNIHFRFGHISIIQYLSAFFNIHYFSTATIAIPLSSMFAFFIYFNFKKIFIFLNEGKIEYLIITFFIFLFSIYSFNRYSGYGNDMPSHIFYFVITLYLLEIKKIKLVSEELFFKISLLTVFLFSVKTFMIITFILPIVLFLLSDNKKQIIVNKKLLILLFLFFLIILKNILVSGCMIYPIKNSCIGNLSFYDEKKTQTVATESEAWAKGWSDQTSDKKLNFNDYNKNFNWIDSWSKKHLKQIINKIFPLLFIYILILFYLNYKKMKNNTEKIHLRNNNIVLYLFIFNTLLLFLWFLKFPLYRYGSSIIIMFSILLLVLLFRKINNFNLDLSKNVVVFFIIIFTFAASSKNFLRIKNDYKKAYFDSPWPKIYSFEELNEPKIYDKVINENSEIVYYYSSDQMCMYSRSPCTGYKKENLKITKWYNYKIYSN